MHEQLLIDELETLSFENVRLLFITVLIYARLKWAKQDDTRR